jgi:hypothetical protein
MQGKIGLGRSKAHHIFSRLAVLFAGKPKMKAGFSARRAELCQIESLEVVISVTHVHSKNLTEVDVHHESILLIFSTLLIAYYCFHFVHCLQKWICENPT